MKMTSDLSVERGTSTAFSISFAQNLGFYEACVVAYHKLSSGVLCSPASELVWPARRLATLFSGGRPTVVMARPLDEIVRLDRLWFRAHSETRHHCRSPDNGELAFCENKHDPLLVMAIRHVGRGRIVAARANTAAADLSSFGGTPWKTSG
jgi:hypothetical protein